MHVEWINFYLAVAAASATLAALIFIAIGNSLRAWSNHELRRLIGLRTFADFVLPFLFAMTALMPSFDWRISALFIAYLGSRIAWQYSVVAKRNPAMLNSDFDKLHFDTFRISASPYILLGLLAFGAFFPGIVTVWISDAIVYGIADLMLIIILVGLLKVWDFYVHPPQSTDGATPSQSAM